MLESKYWGRARLYWLQIFQDDELVRDFRPCLKYGEAALYDGVSKTIFYPTGDPLGYDNSVAADPDEVVYVDYIESDGFTHLDTQVSAASPIRATGSFSWTQLRTSNEEKNYMWTSGDPHRSYLACGCYNSSSDANRFYLIDETSQKLWIGYGNNSKSFGSAMAAGAKYDFEVSFESGSQTASLTPEGGSATTTSFTWSGEASGQGNLYLFACNDVKNKKPIYQSVARCYGLTVWQGEDGVNPVRNFRPCVKDGQAALYDTVSQRIFYPIPAIPAVGNTGAVKEESKQSPIDAYLEYVESDGSQYIDTGVEGRSGTRAEFIETNLRPDNGGEECFLGAIGSASDSRFYMWYHGNTYTLGLGYGETYWRPSLNDPTKAATQWGEGYADVYRLRCGDTTRARVSFADGAQTFSAFDGATGNWKLYSTRALSGNVDTDCNLYVFALNNNGTPDAFSRSRLYWMKLYQDGRQVRKFQPVRLKNGLVGLWDFIGKSVRIPKTSTGGFASFSAVGPETEPIYVFRATQISVR